jgi:hypothetical protein
MAYRTMDGTVDYVGAVFITRINPLVLLDAYG